MTTDTTALQERIARAMWDHDNAHMSQQWRDMAWDDMGGSEPSDERIAYLLRATAVLPIIAAFHPGTALALLDEVDGAASLCDRQAEILTDIAATVHGPPPSLTAWSHHDLAEKVAEMARERDALRAQVERVREALLASDDGTEHEHDRDHGQAEGSPDCPGCWVETIRRALDREVEA